MTPNIKKYLEEREEELNQKFNNLTTAKSLEQLQQMRYPEHTDPRGSINRFNRETYLTLVRMIKEHIKSQTLLGMINDREEGKTEALVKVILYLQSIEEDISNN